MVVDIALSFAKRRFRFVFNFNGDDPRSSQSGGDDGAPGR